VDNKFAERLKRLRQEKGDSLRELAARFEMNAASLSNYELGKNEPKLSMVEKLAEYYGVSVDYLLGRVDNPRKPVEIEDEELYNIALLTDELPPDERQKIIKLVKDGFALMDREERLKNKQEG